VQVTVGKWGNNLAVRLPREIVESTRLRDGDRVDIETQNGDVLIRRADPAVTLAELFGGGTADEWRAEYAGAYDWGPDVGREVIPE
jgi:antitoxin MazE